MHLFAVILGVKIFTSFVCFNFVVVLACENYYLTTKFPNAWYDNVEHFAFCEEFELYITSSVGVKVIHIIIDYKINDGDTTQHAMKQQFHGIANCTGVQCIRLHCLSKPFFLKDIT